MYWVGTQVQHIMIPEASYETNQPLRWFRGQNIYLKIWETI